MQAPKFTLNTDEFLESFFRQEFSGCKLTFGRSLLGLYNYFSTDRIVVESIMFHLCVDSYSALNIRTVDPMDVFADIAEIISETNYPWTETLLLERENMHLLWHNWDEECALRLPVQTAAGKDIFWIIIPDKLVKLDYAAMREAMKPLAAELARVVFSPVE